MAVKTKQKRAKLDPEENMTVTQAQERLSEEPVNRLISANPVPITEPSSIHELRERLHAKIVLAKGNSFHIFSKRE